MQNGSYIRLHDSHHKASELLKIEKAGDRVIFYFDNKNNGTVLKSINDLIGIDFAPGDTEPIQLNEIPFIKEMLGDKTYLEVSKDNIVVASKISYMQAENIDSDAYASIYLDARHYGSISTKKGFSTHDQAVEWMDHVMSKRFEILK